MTTVPRLAQRLEATSRLYLAFTLVFVVVVSVLALRDHQALPVVDDWRLLDHYQSKELVDFLFASEHGHHMPVTLALFALDYEVFGGGARLQVASSLLLLALIAASLWRFFRDGDPRADASFPWALCFMCFLLFWAASCHDLLLGIETAKFQTAWLLVISLYALAHTGPRDGRSAWPRLAVAALAAALASFSQGAGIAAWAALVVVMLLRRFPWRVVLPFALLGALIAVLRGLSVPPEPGLSVAESLRFAIAEPLEMAAFVLAFVGSAPTWVAVGVGLLGGDGFYAAAIGFGALGVLAFGFLAVAAWRGRGGGSVLDTLHLGLMTFAMGAGLVVGMVRVPFFGAQQALGLRFILLSTLFWLGAAGGLAARGAGASAPRSRAALGVALVWIVSACTLPALRDARAIHELRRSEAARLTLTLLLGVHHDPFTLEVALHEPALVYRVAARLRRDGRHPFGERGSLHGARRQDLFEDAGVCPGDLDPRGKLVRGSRARLAEVSGWVGVAGSSGPRFLLLTDDEGVIRGLGDLAAADPTRATLPGMRRWAGFIAGYEPSTPYTAYAVGPDGRTACRLGRGRD